MSLRTWIGNAFGFYSEIENLQIANTNLSEAIESFKKKDIANELRIKQLQDEATKLLGEIDMIGEQLPKADPMEKFWNEKYPKVNKTYTRIESDGIYQIDVRNFIACYRDNSIPVVIGKTNDEKALNGLKWIIKNIRYVKDEKEYGREEYWAMPWQTMKRKRGDCEDGSNLLYCILLKSGVPYFRIRQTAGDTSAGGHCYTTYLPENNDHWVNLDWCYFPKKTPVSERPDYKDETLYKGVWFSFNLEHAYEKGTKSTSVKNNEFLKNFKTQKSNTTSINLKEKPKKARK